MPTVFIVIQQSDNPSRIAGSRADLVLSTPVVLSNSNDIGVLSWSWILIDKPAGSVASLSTPSQAISGFTPDIAGTYLIQLTVNGTLSSTVGAAVKTTNLHIRIPAAKETDEFDANRGWAGAVDSAFAVIDDGYGGLLVSSGVSSASNSDGSLTVSPSVGSVVASLNTGHANTFTAKQTFNSHIAIDGYTFDLSSGAASGQALVYTGSSFAAGTVNSDVTTIAALRSANVPATIPASVNLLGYYSSGDGGGGSFYWDATSIEADNAGTIIKPTSVSGAGRWKRIIVGNALNVLWFGAKADHTDDLGLRIIAADAALGANDGIIEVPDGYYLIGTHFVLNAGHVLKLGKGTFDNNLDTGPIITLNDRTAVIGDGIYTKLVEPKVTVQGTTWQVIIADFNTFGTGTAKVNGSPGAANPGNVDILVENIKFVKGSEFTNSSQALVQFGNVSRTYVKNCYFEESSGFAVSFGGSSADGYHAEDCQILDCYAINCATQVFAVVNCNRFTISRNSIIAAGQRSTPATYIDVELNASTDVATNWIISDNIFDGRGATTTAGYAIQVVGQGVPIENNAVAPDAHIGVIANNTFFGGDSAGADFWQAAITLVQAAHVLIEGNVIQHSPEGVNLFISLNCTVRNNHLAGCGSGGGVGAIQLSGAKYCIVQDNTLILDSIENFNPANHIIESDYFFDSAFRHPDFNSIIGNSLNNNPPGSLPASNSTYQPYILLTGANSRTYGNFINGRPTDDTALINVAELRSAVYPGLGAPSPISKFVRIAGWITPGDGGAGTYVWNDADTRTDDGMFVIKPDVITEPPLTGRWNRADFTSMQSITMSLSDMPSFSVPVPLTFAIPLWLPADVIQVRIKIANQDVTGTNAPMGAVAGVDVGFGTSNGSNGYSGSPVTYLSNSIPGDGTYYTSPWTNVTHGSDGKIIVAIAIPTGASFFGTPGGITWGLRSTSSNSVNPLPIGMSANTSMPFDMHVEYVTAAKRLVVLGDSLAVGYTTDNSVTIEQDAFYQTGPNYGYAVDDAGVPGSTLGQWNSGRPLYSDQQRYSGAYCLIEVGINDLVSMTLTQYQNTILAKAAALKTAGAKAVFVMTPTPSVTYSAEESLRQTWLAWLRAGGIANVDGILDADLILRDPNNHAQLLSSYAAVDGTHWSVAGHAAVAPWIQTLVEGITPTINVNSSLLLTPNTGNVTVGINTANANTWTAKQTFSSHIAVDGYTIDLSGGVTSGQILEYDGYNFVAVSGGGGGAVSSVSNSDSTLTVTPTTGAVVASLNLGHANTWTADQTVPNLNVNAGGNITSPSQGATNTIGLTIAPNVADGASSIGTVISTATSFVTLGSKILQLQSGAGVLGAFQYHPLSTTMFGWRSAGNTMFIDPSNNGFTIQGGTTYFYSGGAARYFADSASFSPFADSSYTLGNASQGWKDGYFGANAVIANTSAAAANTTAMTIAPNVVDGVSSIGLTISNTTALSSGKYISIQADGYEKSSFSASTFASGGIRITGDTQAYIELSQSGGAFIGYGTSTGPHFAIGSSSCTQTDGTGIITLSSGNISVTAFQLAPDTDGTRLLGASGNHWANVYASAYSLKPTGSFSNDAQGLTNTTGMTIAPNVADGYASIAFKINSTTALSTAGNRIISIQNGGSELVGITAIPTGFQFIEGGSSGNVLLEMRASDLRLLTAATGSPTGILINYNVGGGIEFMSNGLDRLVISPTAVTATAAPTGSSYLKISDGTSVVGFGVQSGAQLLTDANSFYPSTAGAQLGASNTAWYGAWINEPYYSIAVTTQSTATMTIGFGGPTWGTAKVITLTTSVTAWSITAPGSAWGAVLTITLVQGGSGSNTLAGAASNIKWLPTTYLGTDHGAPTLTTAVGARDTFVFHYDGTNWIEVSRNMNN